MLNVQCYMSYNPSRSLHCITRNLRDHHNGLNIEVSLSFGMYSHEAVFCNVLFVKRSSVRCVKACFACEQPLSQWPNPMEFSTLSVYLTMWLLLFHLFVLLWTGSELCFFVMVSVCFLALGLWLFGLLWPLPFPHPSPCHTHTLPTISHIRM